MKPYAALYPVWLVPHLYEMAAAPLLVVAACGIDEGLNGRVMYRITLTLLF